MNHSTSKKNILIFIPAYNVEKKIYSVISRIPKEIFLENNIDLLIINDFSSDETSSEIEKINKDFDYNFIVYNCETNLGYGGVQKYAFKYGIKNSYEYLIMLHGDGQYAPEELPRFIEMFHEDNVDAEFG
jgi:glycosyltransferase involved in cell wall biosynthesis